MVCIQRTTMENVTTYFIVGYAGGTAGDLITALLNPTDVELDGTRVIVPDHRVKLKKPRRFADDEAKNKYIQEFKNTVSLSSHDLEYHIRKHHPFIGITVRYKLAYWAAERFKDLHSDNIWRQMGNGTVEDYAEDLLDISKSLIAKNASHVLRLEDIVDGLAIEKLRQFSTIPKKSEEFYDSWLRANGFK
mgnify:FL=1